MTSELQAGPGAGSPVASVVVTQVTSVMGSPWFTSCSPSGC